MKSIDQTSLIDLGTDNDSGFSLVSRFFGFDPQIQLQLSIYPIDALVVPAKSFDIAQRQEAKAKAPVALLRGQPD